MAKKTRGGRRYFARRSRGNHHRKSFTLPLAVVAGFAPVTINTIQWGKNGGINGAVSEFTRTMTGFDPFNAAAGFQPAKLTYGLYPVLGGLAVHWIAGRLGINRLLGRMGIPVIRI